LAAALGAILLVLVVALVGGIFLLSRVYAEPPQPLVFKHQQHIAAGASCLYCHPGARDGAVAGYPSLAKCMGCHNNVQPKNPADQADIDLLLKAWETKQPVQWVKINDQPDFVQFNHRPHIAAGVACESCHGNVSQMGIAQRYNLNMGFCLNCHRQQAPEKVKRLIDCATCHY
jgi:hypothetical protein